VVCRDVSAPAPGTPAVGAYGIWDHRLTRVDAAEAAEAAAELEELRFGALWLGGNSTVDQARPLIAATSTLAVATGIQSIWTEGAEHTAGRYAELEAAHPGRFLLGLGVSHAKLAPRYRRPYQAMVDYLDVLDHPAVVNGAAPDRLPAHRRVLAALGPQMLRLSRDRAAGAHPYLVTPEHTAEARQILGGGPLLAPEVGGVLETDPVRAREAARGALAMYLELPNYTNSWLRQGFAEDDFAGGGSDRLVDALFAWGDTARIRERIGAYRAAGADHVALQLIAPEAGTALPRQGWRELAATLA
jgi:probable F420-dependent oxidoreductase